MNLSCNELRDKLVLKQKPLFNILNPKLEGLSHCIATQGINII